MNARYGIWLDNIRAARRNAFVSLQMARTWPDDAEKHIKDYHASFRRARWYVTLARDYHAVRMENTHDRAA